MIPISDTETYKTPWINTLLIFINIVVFIYMLITPDLNKFIHDYSLIPSFVDFSDLNTLYSFVSSTFLHSGVMHIVSNMWFLWIFGDNVEEELGSFVYLLFYILGGILSGFFQYIFMTGSNIPSLGASGAIAAVLGFYLVMFPDNEIKVLFTFGTFGQTGYTSAYYMLFSWGLFQLFNSVGTIVSGTLNTGGVGWLAHLGGFIFGVVVGKIWQKFRFK